MAIKLANPATAQAISRHSQPGDIIEFASGVYENPYPETSILEIRNSGQYGLPITYKPARGATVIFAPMHNWSAIYVEANYINVIGFKVLGRSRHIKYEEAFATSITQPPTPYCNANGVSVYYSHHVIIDNLKIVDMPGGGIYVRGGDHTTIRYNDVIGCCLWSRYGQSGISVHKSVDIDDNYSKPKIVVTRNSCHGNENRIAWEKTGKIQDGHGIILDENQSYRGQILVSHNTCFNNGGLGIQRLTSPTARLANNFELGNDRSNVT